MSEKTHVFYPGHLGAEPQTVLRDRLRGVRWSKGKVIALPRADALDLIRLQGFFEAEPLTACAARTGLAPDQIRAIARTAGDYVVLDQPTARALRSAAAAAPQTAEPAPAPRRRTRTTRPAPPPRSDRP